MNEIERFQVKEYTGTLESLKEMIINLKLETYEYFFDVLTDELWDHKHGIRYRIGDMYHFPLSPVKFEAIG